jgi:predicted kinase
MSTTTRETQPRLIIVSGAPASGKSTLAERLARELHHPLLAKDAFKESLADTLGSRDREWSKALGLAAMRLLYDVAARLLRAGDDAVIESNFYRGISEADLAPLVSLSQAVMIHCQAPAGIITRRYVDRDASGVRHAVHTGGDLLAELEPKLEAGVFEPLALDLPLICVDTSDGYDPPLAEVLARIGQV